MNSKKDKKLSVIAITTAIITTIISAISPYLIPEKLHPDYINLNRPYLEPELVVTEVDSFGFNFSYVIMNNGALPAEDLRYSFKAPGVSGAEFLLPINRQLAPGAKMRYVPQPIKVSFSETDLYNNFVLIISYTSSISGIVKKYKSVFRYIISQKKIKLGNFLYDDANRQEGVFTDDEIYDFIGVKISKIEFEKYPGSSFHFLISFQDSNFVRNKYIYDAGISTERDRISIFLDESNNLVFRIIDSKHEIHLVKIPKGNSFFEFNNPLYLNCEFGNRENTSFMDISINGKLINRYENNKSMQLLPIDNLMKNSVLGADLNGENGGVFDLAEFVIYGLTLNDDERKGMTNHYKDKTIEKWVSFSGNQWLKHENNK